MDWKEINSFAPWLSAFGTIFSALTALWLARRSERLRVAIDSEWGVRYTRVDSAKSVVIRVTNLSKRPLHITGIFWKAMSFSWQDQPIISECGSVYDELSTKLPAYLKENESVDIHIDPSRILVDIIYHDMPFFESILATRSLKIKAEFGGYEFSSPASKSVRQLLYRVNFSKYLNKAPWLIHFV